MVKEETLHQISNKSYKRVTKETKSQQIEQLREYAENYEHIYIFDYSGKCSGPLKRLKQIFTDAVFFMGRKKLAQVALGQSKEDEIKPKIHLISKQLNGQVVLVFSNHNHNEFVSNASSFTEVNYAAPGFKVEEDYILEEGPIDWVDPCIEQLLVPLSVPVLVKEAKLHAYKQYIIAKKGEKIDSKQSKILRLLGFQPDEFKIHLLCHWTNGTFERL